MRKTRIEKRVLEPLLAFSQESGVSVGDVVRRAVLQEFPTANAGEIRVIAEEEGHFVSMSGSTLKQVMAAYPVLRARKAWFEMMMGRYLRLRLTSNVFVAVPEPLFRFLERLAAADGVMSIGAKRYALRVLLDHARAHGYENGGGAENALQRIVEMASRHGFTVSIEYTGTAVAIEGADVIEDGDKVCVRSIKG